MTNALAIYEPPLVFNELRYLEAQAQQIFITIQEHWVKFLEIVLKIKDRKLYKQRGLTWAQYCKQQFGYTDGYIRLLKGSQNLAEHIEGLTGKLPTENFVRGLRSELKHFDEETKADIVTSAHTLSKEIGVQMNKRHVKAIASVRDEIEATGQVSVGGITMVATPESLSAAEKEAIRETEKKFRQTRYEHARKTKTATGVAKRVEYKGKMVTAIIASELPDGLMNTSIDYQIPVSEDES